MRDLAIRLENRPGALAELGEALGRAGVSIEGGGAFVVQGQGIAHFLFADGAAARRALEAAGIEVLADRAVLAQRLDQARPGQLGRLARAMADAGVNIEVVYSDHDNRLIVVADDHERGRAVSQAWMSGGSGRGPVREHEYRPHLEWTGNTGRGTISARDYSRDHEIRCGEKPPIAGSSDPCFRGDRTRWNPEELLVASLAACHQLWYLHLCADAGIVVTAYEDDPLGFMREEADGSGRFVRVVLRPTATLARGSDADQALALHAKAHEKCFIARSVNFPVDIEPRIV